MSTILIIVIVLTLIALGIVAYYPFKIYSDNGNLIIRLGFSQDVIPLEEITIESLPDGAMHHTRMLAGLRLGCVRSGSFRNPAIGKFYMYVKKRNDLILFSYRGSHYLVNDWRSSNNDGSSN